MNLYEKLVDIRKNIDCFTKDKKGFGYKYVSGAQVLDKIRAKMDELGVLLIPGTPSQSFFVHHYDKVDDRGEIKKKVDFVVSGPMTYTWVNAEKPDEREECRWSYYGQQGDISQSFGSALTYSERYFILKFFGVPTDEDDPDGKLHSEDMTEEQAREYIVRLKKHAGKTMEQVYREDAGYVRWMAEKANEEVARKAAQLVIGYMEGEIPAPQERTIS
jgi:hypothetical protein